MRKLALLGVVLLGTAVQGLGASVYPVRLDDARAIYLTRDQFAVQGDGKADDSAAIQAAIDKVQETEGEGIVFVPQGRYRITRTIFVWPGIRVIGYGASRPVFVLADNTPGFQQGIGYMVFFAGFRPGNRRTAGLRAFLGPAFHFPPTPPGTVPPIGTVPDANAGTFYSAMSNIDFEIGSGNPAAVGIRFHVAQHGYLAHMNFEIGSGLAAIHEVGNEAEDLHFHGGRYGILARKPSPAWQFTLLDSTFDGQREAAIRENEAGLTLVHDEFKNVPTAISIDPQYSDELWVKDSVFEDIGGPAVVISNENSRMTEINLENIVCHEAPIFARFRQSGRQIAAPGKTYRVKSFSHGLTLAGLGATGVIKTRFDASPLDSMPAPNATAIRSLPPASEWVNLRSLGVEGNGTTDDTAAIQKAIDDHRVLYVPSGRYMVSDTITLRPDTVLIGLDPSTTQFDLMESTAAYQGPGAPKALLEAPHGGSNIVTGIGLYTGGINSRAVAAMWMAGKDSLMDDVRFLGGHGTNLPDGKRMNPYNNTHTADPDIHRRWDAQYPSLWIDNGGGGTFANIWTPDTFAQAGLYISNTATPGFVYELSSEHHVRNEIMLDKVANWELNALQTEEESGEGPFASSLEIAHSKNITVANYHGYRVVHSYQPFPYAISITDSQDIRFRNVHVDSNSSMASCDGAGVCRQIVRSSKVSFENAIVDPTSHAKIRDREFAWLDVPGSPVPPQARRPSPVLAPGAKVTELANGFDNISGAAADAAGRLYFVDSRFQRIYQWSPATKSADVVRDNPLDPVNLAFDRAGDLLVVSSGGKGETVYSFRPGSPEDQVTILQPEPAAERPGMEAILPVDYWVNGDFTNTLSTSTYEYVSLEEIFTKVVSTRKPNQYVSPDRSVFLPADDVFLQGEPYFGTKWSYLLQSFGLVKAVPGHLFYVTNEAEEKTYSAQVNADGALSGVKLFATQGGESLAQDKEGNVYLAAGEVFVYNPAGKLIDTIDVPERPVDLVFGGDDHRTLFILTHSTLYAVRTRYSGL
ncbi:MAG TPA: glycosyl hydrolase family 28-related protein [Acidobacteriaceae bacterium]|nr:glycosyl hydrolase family 28-related protein [Acidobacteriaceae bacterium]